MLLKKSLRLTGMILATAALTAIGTNFWLARSGPIGSGTSQPPGDAPPTHRDAPAAKPIFAKLEPFTVTLQGSSRNRVLYLAIALRLGDGASLQQVQDYMPLVRDRFLRVLSAQDPDALQSVGQYPALAGALKHALEPPFAANLPAPRVEDVLFTTIMVQ